MECEFKRTNLRFSSRCRSNSRCSVLQYVPAEAYAILFTAACENLDFDPTIGVSFDSTTIDSLTATLLELDGPNIGSFLALKNLDKCTKFCKGEEYNDAVMHYLKAILTNAIDKSNRMLRAKAIECISLVGTAVGKKKFKEDVKRI
ncbi:hypothetical protein Fot_48885 [Forsythia ovata]|uniref:Uncharacterized protein n=1 Tax=Forsythia ovata TaxID=205694 RepID=A0ABD1QAA4_9LAMI